MRDSDEFANIYDEYAQRVRSIFFRMCPAQEVDDLTQECFLKVWDKRATFRGEANPGTWICRIAIHVAYDSYRRKAARPKGELFTEEKEADASTTTVLQQIEGQQIVTLALDQLTPDHRAVLVLHVLEGLSIEEVGQTLEIAPGTAKSRLFHARDQARQFLTRKGINYES